MMRSRFVFGALSVVLLLGACGTVSPTSAPAPDQQAAADAIPLDPQVIGGTPSAAGARPYQVALLSGGRQFCGGTLISDQWVLTAAHCVVGTSATSISVRAGSLYATSGGQLRNVASGRIHPNYTDVTRGYDVAVLRVSSPFSLTNTVNTAALPTPAFAATAAAVGTVQTISGWGMTVGGNRGSTSSTLREANLPVISNSSCASQLGQSIPNGMICGNKNSQGQTGCHGDSGGPFASSRNGKYFVFGVVSWGQANLCSRATAFARVSEYQSWITANTGVQPQGGTAQVADASN
ncbi:serine protease [Deinococcus sp. HMF7604]|uniref:serine protease n=1 Tax=Deinococcus betulae TaxID=2873312 RepID=UPI001CCF3613|nr:serine protease [Deinococcus betulae]MBZ9753538.1 serine protease [Deinococcus betulae]